MPWNVVAECHSFKAVGSSHQPDQTRRYSLQKLIIYVCCVSIVYGKPNVCVRSNARNSIRKARIGTNNKHSEHKTEICKAGVDRIHKIYIVIVCVSRSVLVAITMPPIFPIFTKLNYKCVFGMIDIQRHAPSRCCTCIPQLILFYAQPYYN